MELIVEWTFEGSLKSLESMACREPDPLSIGVYVSTCKRTVKLLKLSGTAILVYSPQSFKKGIEVFYCQAYDEKVQ